MKIYNFICILKGKEFKYKVEAHNLTEAKVKVREHIKNAVEIKEVKTPSLDMDIFKTIFGK